MFRRKSNRDDRSVAAIFFLNGVGDGLSGGDMHALRMARVFERRFPKQVLIASSPDISERSPVELDDLLVPLKTPIEGFRHTGLGYFFVCLIRMTRSILVLPKARHVVATSHFMFDVIPCAIQRARHGALCIGYVYHLVRSSERRPSLRNLVSQASERIGLVLLRRWGNIVFVDNEETEADLLKLGFSPDSIVQTTNAYDPPFEIPSQPVEQQMNRLVFCGRLTESKGIWDLLLLAESLKGRVPASIQVVGEGPLMGPFSQEVRARTLENIEILGFVPEIDKWRYLRGATLFLAPSREEGWGISVGEALYAGTPVIAYDLPAYRHFGDLLFRVPRLDIQEFVDRVGALLNHSEVLEEARSKIATASLPRWSNILESELMTILSNEEGKKKLPG